MRIADQSSVTRLSKYVHASPEAMKPAFERLETFNAAVKPITAGKKQRTCYGIRYTASKSL